MGNYDTIIALWEDGRIDECSKLFSRMKEEKALTEEEIKKLESIIPDKDELFNGKVNDAIDSQHIFKLYNTVKSKRNWSDDDLSRNLKISKEEMNRIKTLRTKSKSLFFKLLNECLKK